MTRRGEGTGARLMWRRAYRALLPVLPYGLRVRQGDAMLETFDRELRRSEPAGVCAVWLAGLMGLTDLVRRGGYERLSEERRALSTANVTILGRLAFAFVVTSVVLTASLVVKGAVTRAAAPPGGTMLGVMLYSIPYVAALTIPMSVFIAVLWVASRRPRAGSGGDPFATGGELRLAPVLCMASVVALCCLALNAEMVPRANLRLQAMYAGQVAVTPSDRSMTLYELREAEATLRSVSRAVSASATGGVSFAQYEVEIQKKFALAAACVLLTLLAAGISRRAAGFTLGIRAQAGISVVVLASYYVCIMVGERLAERSAIPPAPAMWSANVIVLVLGLLTLRGSRGQPGERATQVSMRV